MSSMPRRRPRAAAFPTLARCSIINDYYLVERSQDGPAILGSLRARERHLRLPTISDWHLVPRGLLAPSSFGPASLPARSLVAHSSTATAPRDETGQQKSESERAGARRAPRLWHPAQVLLPCQSAGARSGSTRCTAVNTIARRAGLDPRAGAARGTRARSGTRGLHICCATHSQGLGRRGSEQTIQISVEAILWRDACTALFPERPG